MNRLSRANAGPLLQELQRCVSRADARSAIGILDRLQKSNSAELSPECIVLATRAAIAAHLPKRNVDEIWSRMQICSFTPSIYHYTSVLGQYGKLREASEAVAWFGRIKSANLQPDFRNYSSIMYAYAKCSKTNEATTWLSQAKDDSCIPTAASFSKVVDFFCTKGKQIAPLAEMASRDSIAMGWLLKEMPKHGIVPDVQSFASCIAAHVSAGRDSDGHALWAVMRSSRNLTAGESLQCYEQVLLALSRRQYACAEDGLKLVDEWFGRMTREKVTRVDECKLTWCRVKEES